jgi:diadenosine tetraphosphatase ApaH/serine/threonine PP2A family protein phosphatase
MYAVVDRTRQKMTFHRVPYNHAEAAAAIRQANLPEYFAQRLERGR